MICCGLQCRVSPDRFVMVRLDLHLPPTFVTWMALFLATFSRRSRAGIVNLTSRGHVWVVVMLDVIG
jgi:hypothetical protein